MSKQFPENYSEAMRMHLFEITVGFMPDRHRSIEWLEENGVCYDNVYRDKSTIEVAGDGLFASREIKEGMFVAPMPFLHIFDKRNMDIYAWEEIDNVDELTKTKISHQLMLNYCLTHNESSILLCTMSHAAFVNHRSTQNCNSDDICPDGPNVKYRWASWDSTNSWLEYPLTEIYDQIRGNSRALSMELIALRDISPGEEIFMDYGDGWEAKWNDHVDNWEPPKGDFGLYQPVKDFQNEWGNKPFRTMEELQENPYPPNIGTVCLGLPMDRCDPEEDSNMSLSTTKVIYSIGEKTWNIYDHSIDGSDFFIGSQTDKKVELDVLPCQVIDRTEDGETYMVRLFTTTNFEKGGKLPSWLQKEEPCFIQNLRKESIYFGNRPYTSDMWLPGAFRHPIEVNDEIFPKHWKDLKLV